MTEKSIKRQKLGGFGANFLEENLERAILTREILIIFLFFIYPWMPYQITIGLFIIFQVLKQLKRFTKWNKILYLSEAQHHPLHAQGRVR